MNAKDRILTLLRDGHSGATNMALAAIAEVSIVTVDNFLRKLEAEAKIERRRIGRRRQITVRL